jgi:hypothetical protein
MLMETQGDVFYITNHYRNSRYVLMRLSRAEPATVQALLRRRWFEVAPKKLHAVFGEPSTAVTTPKAARAPAQEKISKAPGQVRRPRR